VRDNAAGFGGDPSRVTIFGQSAGAQNVWILMASPSAKGLFHRAIAHSGLGLTDTAENVEGYGADIAGKLGCADAACLRSKPFAEIVAAVPGEGGVGKKKIYVPNVDGVHVPKPPLQAIADREHSAVPMIVGTTSEETMFDFGAVPDEATYRALAHSFYDASLGAAKVDAAIARYPSSVAGPRAALVALTTDQRFGCPGRRALGVVAASQDAPVFRYVFTHPSTRALAGRGLDAFAPFGAFHLWDLYFLFGTFGALKSPFTPDEGERALAADLASAWVRFAGSGDPNGGALVAWPRWTKEDPYLEWRPGPKAGSAWRAEACAFWDGP
jgi:para-nitrobenzyl esterase